jgi:ribosomal protein S18 acetylase RimI-like enzyme
MIQRYLDEPNSILLVAEHNGELVGSLDLTGNQRRKLYHTGMIGMGIHNEWQNNGIGTLLLSNCIKWAKENSPLTIVWLEVYSTNTSGRKLYEKTGFQNCGEIKNFFKNADKITMVQHL